MRSKTLLAAFLLGVGLCFAPALGYGEEMDIDQLRKELAEDKVSRMRVILLEAKVDYMMTAPTTFLRIDVGYDRLGLMRMVWELPEGIDTKGKICVSVGDNRGVFSHKSRMALLNRFKMELEFMCLFLGMVVANMNTDVVAIFDSDGGNRLGYFYQGEYHLWGE